MNMFRRIIVKLLKNISFIYLLSFGCLFPTVWLEKTEFLELVNILNKNGSKASVDFKRDIIPLRIQKIRLISNLSDFANITNTYGFFVNIRDIFTLDIVQNIDILTKKRALHYCIEIYSKRMLKMGYHFDDRVIEYCIQCLESSINFDKSLILIDILLTPVSMDIIQNIESIAKTNCSFGEKVSMILDLAVSNFDLFDRNLLYNYIDPFKHQPYKKQLAAIELQLLRKNITEATTNENSYACIFHSMTSLFYLAIDLHNKKVMEALDYISNSQDSDIEEYPTKLWCDCDSVTLWERIFFIAIIVQDFTQKFPPSPRQRINYVSWGTGHFLQDALIIRQLLQLGYTNIDITLIDCLFNCSILESKTIMSDVLYLEAFLLIPLHTKLQAYTVISTFSDENLFFESEKFTKIARMPTLLTAVDISFNKFMGNLGFDKFVHDCQSKIPNIYALTLNYHLITQP